MSGEVLVSEKHYQIVLQDGHKGIECLTCGMVSFHPSDIRHRFCGNCGEFHDDKDRRDQLQDS